MSNRMFRFLLSGLLVLFAASYSIYTAVRYFYSPYQTETVFSYTVADSCRARAVALRDEVLLTADVGGLLSYVCADGEVVIPGMTVAEVYSGGEDLYLQTLIGQYEREISLLKTAQTASYEYLSMEALNVRINEAAGAVTDAVAQSELSELPLAREELQKLLGKKIVSTGRQKDFSERIAYLTAQAQHARSRISQAHTTIKTQTGGYFCSEVDGYETILGADPDALSAEDIERIANGTLAPPSPDADAIGKVIRQHDWYLAMVVDKAKAQRFVPGAAVTLDFNQRSCEDVLAWVHTLRDAENGRALVVFKTNRINDRLIALRVSTVDVRLRSFTGLRVSAEAIRYNGQTEGVYVRRGNLITFKPIERIYEDENFVLCSDSSLGDNPLRLFDEVIVEGVDLYDGKIL
jgi:hypothetical protein